ncbi:MAG: hypothetical protein OEY14_17765 [Myxococcales bacterium]|nr:hypothetical protein [Myxococcales bacterium]
MSDLLGLSIWTLALAGGLGACVALHRRGLARTHVRDLLHIGTGVWVLGWPAWQSAWGPSSLTLGVALATAAVPWAARRSRLARQVEQSLSGDDERWVGLIQYTGMYALLTWQGLTSAALPAASALLALSLGDGMGGAVGLRWGRRGYRVPGGKRKSLEGSLAVWIASALGVALAGWRFGAMPALGAIAALATVSTLAEALAPRGMDNLFVPATVWLAAVAMMPMT